MKFAAGFLLIVLTACGEIPPDTELLNAEREFQESQLNGRRAQGSCDNDEDRIIMRSDNSYFAERWNANSGLGGLNEHAMLAEFPNISQACIQCVGRYTKCSVSRCGLGVCDSFFGFGPRHPKCKECTHNACGADMIKCSGLLPSEWPDFERGDI